MADQRQQQQISVKDERMKKLQYEKRKSTLLKGAKELSVLCDINVCVVILSPDGKLETWPENLDDVRAALRDAANSNKRPRSDNHRKPPPPHANPSQVEIVLDDEDSKKANKKMKAAISNDIGNSVAGGEGGGGTGVFAMGERTEEDHHHPHHLYLYNPWGNYYYHHQGFPVFGEWNGYFEARIGNYENPISCSSSNGYGGGGGYSSSTGYENLPEQRTHNDEYASRELIMFDPLLCVQPPQSRLGGDFQFGNHYI